MSNQIFGLIHAKWCGHCQMLMPEWEKMRKMMGENHDIREIEDGDQDKDQKISEINTKITGDKKLSINGFPTIFKVENGELHMYPGERKAEKMKDWFLGSESKKQKGGKTRRRKSNKRKTRRNHKSLRKNVKN